MGDAARNLTQGHIIRVTGFGEVQHAGGHPRIDFALAQTFRQTPRMPSRRSHQQSVPCRHPNFRCRYGPAWILPSPTSEACSNSSV